MSWKEFYPSKELKQELENIWTEAKEEHEKEQEKARKEKREPAPYNGPTETHSMGANGAGSSRVEWTKTVCKNGNWHNVRVTVTYSYGRIVDTKWEEENTGDSCLHARPLPPDMDEKEGFLSTTDIERIWGRLLLERDMAKRKEGPERPHTGGIPDDLIDKTLGPYIRPTGSFVPRTIKRQIDAGWRHLGYSDLYKDPDSVVKALPPGSGPDPMGPEEYLKPRSVTPPSGWNPLGPRVKPATLPDD